ncbi:hypothetical protein [Stecheria intestinalis]|uniref:hypothetical protein n=1 Tax=Stecheria intestinalis TaxID=2606630 RepID=UPI0012B350B0|nr:hypothetical protein [Stecheria intestinalis]
MTNYERIMNEMTPEMFVEILDGMTNPCLMCSYRKQAHCPRRCQEGIEKWLNQETDND